MLTHRQEGSGNGSRCFALAAPHLLVAVRRQDGLAQRAGSQPGVIACGIYLDKRPLRLHPSRGHGPQAGRQNQARNFPRMHTPSLP
jgi:hypothetical protein